MSDEQLATKVPVDTKATGIDPRKARIGVSIVPRKLPQSPVDLSQVDVAGSTVELPLDQVDFYDRNPRKSTPNASFDELKEWIRVNGSMALAGLHVTKRPGAERYMIAGGGNTRLRAIKDLYIETGDEKYGYIKVVFTPFVSEDVLLASSLGENINRSPMCFWDDAAGVMELKQLIEAETGNKLNAVAFENLLQQKNKYGLKVAKSSIYLYAFAVARLHALGEAVHLLQLSQTQAIQPILNRLVKQALDLGMAEQEFWGDMVDPILLEIGQNCLANNADSIDVDAIERGCANALAKRFPEQASEVFTPDNALPLDEKLSEEESDRPLSSREEQAPNLASRLRKSPVKKITSFEPAPPINHQKQFFGALETFANCVRLETGGLKMLDLIRHQDDLPMGFYVEIPELMYTLDLSIDQMTNRKMVAPTFREAWWFLVLVSGQLNRSVLQNLNPKSLFYEKAMSEDTTWEEFGERMGPHNPEQLLLTSLYNGGSPFVISLYDVLTKARSWIEFDPERFSALLEELSSSPAFSEEVSS